MNGGRGSVRTRRLWCLFGEVVGVYVVVAVAVEAEAEGEGGRRRRKVFVAEA